MGLSMWHEAESQRLRIYELCNTCTIAASCQSIARCSLISLLLPPASRNRLTHYFIQKSCSGSWVVAICCSLLATVSGCGRPKVHQTQSIRVADPKSLENLTKIVEEKIRNILPVCTLGYKPVQLAFSPCESENSQSAETHYQFLLFVLELQYLESLSKMWSPLKVTTALQIKRSRFVSAVDLLDVLVTGTIWQ